MIIWYESGKKLFLLRHFSGIRRKGLRKTSKAWDRRYPRRGSNRVLPV